MLAALTHSLSPESLCLLAPHTDDRMAIGATLTSLYSQPTARTLLCSSDGNDNDRFESLNRTYSFRFRATSGIGKYRL